MTAGEMDNRTGSDAPRDDERQEGEPKGSGFRTNLIRVLLVQVVALALLWALQARYTVL